MKMKWDENRLKNLVQLCKTMTIREAAEQMDVPFASARAAIKNRRISVAKTGFWTEEKLIALSAVYPSTLNSDLAKIFDCKESAISAQAYKLRLRKTPEFRELHSKKGYFPKGNKPHNAGKPMPAHVREKASKTMFQKGNTPQNTLTDGAITIRHLKKLNIKYRYIRLSKGKWIEYYRYVWMQHNGEIPAGFLVRHINGDTLDDRLENLEMIPRTVQIIEHSSSVNLKDGFIAQCIAGERGKNKDLINKIKQMPDLIELKRNQLKLQRLCKQK